MQYYPYDEFLKDLKKLVKKIDFDFEAIVAVARGGMTIAHMLGEYYNTRNVFTINSIAYEDTRRLGDVKVFNVPDLSGFSRVLVVDDIIDSGKSMQVVMDVLRSSYPGTEFKIASIFHKKETLVNADYFVRYADDWIDFFWVVDLAGIKR